MLTGILAATHLPATVALGFGAVGFACMAWYWNTLGQEEVPPARRRVRRASLISGVVALAAAVFGFGIVDPDVRPVPYVFAWALGGGALGVTVAFAVVDALVSFRLHRQELARWRDERRKHLDGLIHETRTRRREGSP